MIPERKRRASLERQMRFVFISPDAYMLQAMLVVKSTAFGRSTTALARVSRSFREAILKFSQYFPRFRSFRDVLGPVRTCSGAFGQVRIHSEAFGSVRTFSEFFGFFQHFSRLCQIPAKPMTKCVAPRRRKSPKCVLSSRLVVCCCLIVAALAKKTKTSFASNHGYRDLKK